VNGKSSSALRGVGLGLAIGGATAMLGNGMMSRSSKRKIKKNANKAFKTMTDFVDNAQNIIK
jgi:gas vesicle protein